MLVLWIIALVFVMVAAVTAAWAGWRAAPFVPTLGRDVERMIALAELKDGEKIVDLGAGDGRIQLAAVKHGPNIRADGYELSVGMWLVAWLRLHLAGVQNRTSIRLQDFFHHDLSGYDVVFCFLTPKAMRKLEPKLRAELKPGARVISAVFPMPAWPRDQVEKPTGRVSVYRYRQA